MCFLLVQNNPRSHIGFRCYISPLSPASGKGRHFIFHDLSFRRQLGMYSKGYFIWGLLNESSSLNSHLRFWQAYHQHVTCLSVFTIKKHMTDFCMSVLVNFDHLKVWLQENMYTNCCTTTWLMSAANYILKNWIWGMIIVALTV